jgi:hypothetical protein
LAGLAACSNGCTDTQSDAMNCGTCGTVCTANQVCAQGTCSTSCGTLLQCGQNCVDPTSNVQNCGTCNNACPAGQSCVASQCACPSGQTACNNVCTNTMTDGANCGSCGNQCQSGATCSAGACIGGVGGAAGASGGAGASGAAGSAGASGGAAGSAGASGAAGGTAGASGSAGAAGMSGGGASGSGGAGTCDAGTTTTTWATGCQTAPTTTCVAPTGGVWIDPGSTTNDPLQCESDHYAVYSPAGTITAAQCSMATSTLETLIWPTLFGSPIFFPEPYCNSATKYKASIVIHSDYGLTGGGWGQGYMGMWVGPGATADHWGLAHEFMHSVQSTTKGLACNQSNTCGWIYESHANWRSHQLAEYHDPNTGNVHCSELLVNFPHLYLGSTRDRYCNWQFMEYLKDKYCYQAVNDIWTAPMSSNDPFTNIMATRGWNISQLNDFFGEWAMHNITWDYKNPDGTDEGTLYRKNYGAASDRTGHAQGAPAGFRELRSTQLDVLDQANRRFVTSSAWAPQRWGYNIVRLFPDAGSTTVTVTFRGVIQTAAANTNFGNFKNQPASEPTPNTDFRWGLVAVDSTGAKPRYSALQRGTDGALSFCISAADTQVWLVVMATPSKQQQIVWDQMYYSVYRYPWMVQVDGALPDGYQANAPNPTTTGQRWANGGGWVASAATVASTVYVGPHASVLGGNVSGNARIDDHAVVVSGTISGNANVNALSVISGITVKDNGVVGTVFQGPGTFESGQIVSGTGQILGDVELRGQGFNVASGVYYGFIDNTVTVDTQQGSARTAPVAEVTAAGPYTWRP